MVETGVDPHLSEGDKKFNAQNSQALNTNKMFRSTDPQTYTT